MSKFTNQSPCNAKHSGRRKEKNKNVDIDRCPENNKVMGKKKETFKSHNIQVA